MNLVFPKKTLPRVHALASLRMSSQTHTLQTIIRIYNFAIHSGLTSTFGRV